MDHLEHRRVQLLEVLPVGVGQSETLDHHVTLMAVTEIKFSFDCIQLISIFQQCRGSIKSPYGINNQTLSTQFRWSIL